MDLGHVILTLLVAAAGAIGPSPAQEGLESVAPPQGEAAAADVAYTDVRPAVALSSLRRERAGRPYDDALVGLGRLLESRDLGVRRTPGFDPYRARRAVTVGSITRLDGVRLRGVVDQLRRRGARRVRLGGARGFAQRPDAFGFAWPGARVALPGRGSIATSDVARPGRTFRTVLTARPWTRSGSAAAAVGCLSPDPLGAFVSAPRPADPTLVGRRVAYDVDVVDGRPRARVCIADRPATTAALADRIRSRLAAGLVSERNRAALADATVTTGGVPGWGWVGLEFEPTERTGPNAVFESDVVLRSPDGGPTLLGE